MWKMQVEILKYCCLRHAEFLDLSGDPSEWGLNHTNAEHIDAVGIVNRAVVWIDDGEDRIAYLLRGVDDGFVEHGAIPLQDWDKSLGDTEEEEWTSLKSNGNFVFVDSSFALVDPSTGESISGMNLPIGKSISQLIFQTLEIRKM